MDHVAVVDPKPRSPLAAVPGTALLELSICTLTYKKEKTGRVACSQPGVTRLLGRLLRVAVRGVCSFVFSDTGHYTKLSGMTRG